MKLHAIEDRAATAAAKRAGDAWDIYRLLMDLDGDGSIRAALADAPHRLRGLVRDAARRVLVERVAETRAWLRAGDDTMRSVSIEDLRYVGELLVTGLG